MSEDFLTRERIQRLQLMGIDVWQERGKRVHVEPAQHVDVERVSSENPQAKQTRTPTSSQRASSSPKSSKPVVVHQPVTPDAPRPDVVAHDWQQLRAAVQSCTACVLCETRTKTVFGVGQQTADLMIIGEAPGAEEDRRGEPFVGRAGQLLDAMLVAIGYKRNDVFIANVLKCRPPGNRDPQASEASQCSAYLNRQIELVKPKVLIAVGRIAAQRLLDTQSSLARLRGKLHHYGNRNIPLVVTYHPAYLLRSPEQKRKAWEDLLMSQKLLKELNT